MTGKKGKMVFTVFLFIQCTAETNYFRVKRGRVKMKEYISKLLFES